MVAQAVASYAKQSPDSQAQAGLITACRGIGEVARGLLGSDTSLALHNGSGAMYRSTIGWATPLSGIQRGLCRTALSRSVCERIDCPARGDAGGHDRTARRGLLAKLRLKPTSRPSGL